MRIAIQGHPTRGKEVIQILKNLGGKSREELTGRRISQYYFINCNGDIDLNLKINLLNHKLYTLEEFEKEFPFKIGDIVLLKGTDLPYEIVALEWFINKLCCKLDNGFHYAPNTLTTYEKMKEERNITLTLDKAKEWYKKGGELKEVALQAFTEKELIKTDLPKTWEEFCKNYPIERGEFYITSLSEIHESTCSRNRCSEADKNVCSSQKSAEAHLAMIQLEKLRDCWRQGWEPTPHQTVFAIKFAINGLSVYEYCSREFLSFKDRKTATEFLKCFRDLIEKAGDLI